MKSQLLILSMVLASVACKKDEFVGIRETSTASAYVEPVIIAPEVDFLFIIDDSQSMNQVQTELARGMQDFVKQTQSGSEKDRWDIRVAAVKTTPVSNISQLAPTYIYANKGPSYAPFTSSTANLSSILTPGVAPSGSNYEMGILNGALWLENYSNLFRSNSLLVVVAISNEEDWSGYFASRPGFDSSVPVPYPVSTLQNRYSSSKGDPELIKFFSLVPTTTSYCSALRMPATSIGSRFITMSTNFSSPVIDICQGANERIPVSNVIEALKTTVTVIRQQILLNAVVLDREPITIDRIVIDGKAIESGFQVLGYKSNYNISANITTSGEAAPNVAKSGWVIKLPEGVYYTSKSVVDVDAHFVP